MSNAVFAGVLPAVIVITSSTGCARTESEPVPSEGRGAYRELGAVRAKPVEPRLVDAASDALEQMPKGQEAGPKGKEAGPKGKEAGPKAQDAGATPGSDAASNGCPDPRLGTPGVFGFASATGSLINRCIATHEPDCLVLRTPSDVAVDYGNFPFDRSTPAQYFYAVVADGHEGQAFFDGAIGNLSDATPSAVDGDRGSGDSIADRTLVVGGPFISLLFPSSHGTHPISFPPSQFMNIHLAPFDTTPEGRYVLAICPVDATSHCDCAFERFTLMPRVRDAGAAHDAAAMCPDM